MTAQPASMGREVGLGVSQLDLDALVRDVAPLLGVDVGRLLAFVHRETGYEDPRGSRTRHFGLTPKQAWAVIAVARLPRDTPPTSKHIERMMVRLGYESDTMNLNVGQTLSPLRWGGKGAFIDVQPDNGGARYELTAPGRAWVRDHAESFLALQAEPATPSKLGATSCPECGSVVSDIERHRAFHNVLADLRDLLLPSQPVPAHA